MYLEYTHMRNCMYIHVVNFSDLAPRFPVWLQQLFAWHPYTTDTIKDERLHQSAWHMQKIHVVMYVNFHLWLKGVLIVVQSCSSGYHIVPDSTHGRSQLKCQKLRVGSYTEEVLKWFNYSRTRVHPRCKVSCHGIRIDLFICALSRPA